LTAKKRRAKRQKTPPTPEASSVVAHFMAEPSRVKEVSMFKEV